MMKDPKYQRVTPEELEERRELHRQTHPLLVDAIKRLKVLNDYIRRGFSVGRLAPDGNGGYVMPVTVNGGTVRFRVDPADQHAALIAADLLSEAISIIGERNKDLRLGLADSYRLLSLWFTPDGERFGIHVDPELPPPEGAFDELRTTIDLMIPRIYGPTVQAVPERIEEGEFADEE